VLAPHLQLSLVGMAKPHKASSLSLPQLSLWFRKGRQAGVRYLLEAACRYLTVSCRKIKGLTAHQAPMSA
jgi:hypothetical protein